MESREHPPSYKIYVKMLKTVPLDVKCTDTIDQIKSKISAIEGIDKSHQTLLFAGNQLENNRRLADYDILTNSSVDLYVTDGMQISVRIPSVGKIIKLDVKKSQSIADVKAAIEQKGGIPRDKQILMYGCQQLEDDKLIGQCGLSNGQKLHVLVCPTDGLQISVNVEGGRTVNLNVKSWYTIADVKMMIETLEGEPAFNQILMRAQSGAGAQLKDTESLKSLHVENGEVLTLYQSIQLFIKTWEGKTVTMSVKKSGTVKDVMKKIEKRLPLKEGKKDGRAAWNEPRTSFLVSIHREYNLPRHHGREWLDQRRLVEYDTTCERQVCFGKLCGVPTERHGAKAKKGLQCREDHLSKSGFGWDDHLKMAATIDGSWAKLPDNLQKSTTMIYMRSIMVRPTR